MSTKQVTFTTIAQRAEDMPGKLRLALVYPDETLIEAAQQAVQKDVVEIVALSRTSIPGLPTKQIASPKEAILKAIELTTCGKVDTLAKGLVNTSTFLSKLVASELRSGYVTHTSILEVSGFPNVFVISDGTVTPQPTLEQKVDIVKNGIRCSELLGVNTPKVALLSANEMILPGVPSGHHAAILCKMAERGQLPSACIDGPIALDSALSAEAVRKKHLSFAFDPPADVLIAPDLESGAFLIKAAVYFGKANVAGLLWGTQKPIVLTSRADTARAKYISICLCKLAVMGNIR